MDITLAPRGARLIVAEVGAKRIVEIDPQTGKLAAIAGNRPCRSAGWTSDQHPNRRRSGGNSDDLLLVGCGECDLQGGEEVGAGLRPKQFLIPWGQGATIFAA